MVNIQGFHQATIAHHRHIHIVTIPFVSEDEFYVLISMSNMKGGHSNYYIDSKIDDSGDLVLLLKMGLINEYSLDILVWVENGTGFWRLTTV